MVDFQQDPKKLSGWAEPILYPATDEDRLLVRICEVVRDEMKIRDESVRYGFCVPATANLIDVMQHFHLNAEPMSVYARVYNAPMTEWILREGREPSVEESEQLKLEGCYSVTIGRPDYCSEGIGHLVALADTLAGYTLIDMTLDQANHHAPCIAIPERVLIRPIDAKFSQAQARAVTALGGCLVCYYAQPRNRSF